MPRRSSNDIAFAGPALRISPPPDLDGDAKALFLDVVTNSRADFFIVTDAPLLAEFCEAVCQAKQARAGLKADGYVMADGKPSGWLPVLQAATRTMSTYSRMLRLNPSARAITPTAPKEPAPPVSYYERQALEAKRNGDHEAH